MKTLFIICCFIATSWSAVSEKAKYTTKYDNVNLEEIVHNDRLLENYVDCLMEKGNCSPDGLELKKNMPDAIETDCSKCSDKQKEGSEYIIRYLIDNKPEYWNPLQEKYDPSGTYKQRYLESKKEEVKVEPISKS
ncbi:ejaculatory bulb-specific protein 3-like [Diabrotica virgifera virgifera]|uniref:Ejaculatory bulb-specific protein 3-like n=1 Tax=Diabrotica virgifera virgifera TaxID=50390 RepID=A0A6P7G9M4_DIAVI|nr:ejaculatory bulb-specific protein 3-like [Diabrotica virgifera virgifera]